MDFGDGKCRWRIGNPTNAFIMNYKTWIDKTIKRIIKDQLGQIILDELNKNRSIYISNIDIDVIAKWKVKMETKLD
jgi:hypothetical protein